LIREAEIQDFEAILDMCETFWKHTQFDEPFERDHTRKMVQMSYDHGLLLVADNDGIEGFIAAVAAPLLGSSSAIAATELAWWVNPEKRGNMSGVKLLTSLERLCIKRNVKYLNLAYMQSSMPEQVRSMYERMGYKLQETLYTKVINGSNNISGSSVSGVVSLCRRPTKERG